MTKSVTFDARISGDCECFCWDDVPIEQRSVIALSHSIDEYFGDRLDRLHPNDLVQYLGCEYGKQYRFTLTVEEIT